MILLSYSHYFSRYESLVQTALFCAIATVISFIEIPLFAFAPFLTFDLSCAFIVGVCWTFGEKIALRISFFSWLAHLLFNPFGFCMSLLFIYSFLCIFIFITHKHHTTPRLVVGLLFASIGATLISCAGNFVITPLYTGMPLSAIATLIVPVLLPFNLIKSALTSLVIFVTKPYFAYAYKVVRHG